MNNIQYSNIHNIFHYIHKDQAIFFIFIMLNEMPPCNVKVLLVLLILLTINRLMLNLELSAHFCGSLLCGSANASH